ncbi:MAG: hypothetical protein M9945_18005 [Aquamicrobium sp.]|uniref:hypothetical protein n=1 Tax=Aquamicrobium sp. TaxID=1872579 RepID=UPI00349EA4DD|nr:hypothetical protein [Aquamicrobium sp.]
MALIEETVVSPVGDDARSYIDWPAIFAGAAVAAAISLVLLTFGTALGLSLTSAHEGQSASLFWIAIVGGLWLLWVQVSASMAGGYLAGRMRRRHGDATESESDLRDGSHGLVVWAVATLAAAVIAYSGAMGTVTAVGQTAGAAASAAGSAVAQAVDVLDPNDLLIDRTLRGTPGAASTDEGTRSEVGRILLSAATSDEGMTDADRQYLVALVAQRAGIAPEEAERRIDEVAAQAAQFEQQAREAADQARRTAMIAAFLAAVSLLVSAAAAYFAGTLGGNHRDKQTMVEGWYRPW